MRESNLHPWEAREMNLEREALREFLAGMGVDRVVADWKSAVCMIGDVETTLPADMHRRVHRLACMMIRAIREFPEPGDRLVWNVDADMPMVAAEDEG